MRGGRGLELEIKKNISESVMVSAPIKGRARARELSEVVRDGAVLYWGESGECCLGR